MQTVEMDYPGLHPRLMYAEVGKPMIGDPYDLPNWPRDLVKVAFNTLVNAGTRQAAIRSIANTIGGKGAFAKAKALVCEIEAEHTSIADMFGTGAGLWLMRRDSDMAERLLLRLARRRIIALPIHDSFIVPIADKGDLLQGMAEALHKSVGNSFNLSGTYPESLPQYGARQGNGGPALPLPLPKGAPPGDIDIVGYIVVFFPESQQRDFFGATAPAVPVSDLFKWSSGRAPVGVQKALRHEMRRRGLGYVDMARRALISRPQFGNILRGRFGASRAVASRLRDFLIEGAKTVGTSSAVQSTRHLRSEHRGPAK